MVESDFDIKTKIMNIIESVGMSDMRAARCDLDDFLKYVYGVYICERNFTDGFIFVDFYLHSIVLIFIFLDLFFFLYIFNFTNPFFLQNRINFLFIYIIFV